jgi:hypothetical protein
MDLFDATNIAIDRIIDACDKAAKPSPVIADCDVCSERPGSGWVNAAGGIETWVCDECIDEEHDRMLGRRLPRFRTRDERDAYMAGSKAYGEI